MDIDEINTHIHKLKCGSTDWQSVEKLAALCTVRNELSEAESRENSPAPQPEPVMQMEYSTRPREQQSEFVEAASAVPFSGLMEVLDRHMNAIKLVYPKEYELVIKKNQKSVRLTVRLLDSFRVFIVIFSKANKAKIPRNKQAINAVSWDFL